MGILMHWLWLLIAALVGVGSSGLAGLPESEWTTVQVGENQGVVLPPRDAPGLLLGPGVEAEGFWYPRDEHLLAAEDALRDQSHGYRQYAGYIEDGQRKIAINAFCTSFRNWRREVIFVMDGGDCYWQAIYNVTTGEVDMLTVNGEA